MTRLFGLLAFSVAVSLHAYGEDVKCGCDEVPFKPDPPCVKACVASIIKYSDFNELTANVDLNDEQSYSISQFRNPTPKDNVTLETVFRQGRNLKEVESKLVSLPNSRLERIIMTVPAAKRTVFIPADEIELYKLDKSSKQ